MGSESAPAIKPTMAQIIERFLPAYRQHYSLTPDQASACGGYWLVYFVRPTKVESCPE